jgi:hypothetical protein
MRIKFLLLPIRVLMLEILIKYFQDGPRQHTKFSTSTLLIVQKIIVNTKKEMKKKNVL